MQNDPPLGAGGDVPPIPAGYSKEAMADAFDEGEPTELVPCEGCGRKFKEAALERHAKICKKVFQEKRKAFDSVANRLGEIDDTQKDQLIKNAKKIQKEVVVKKQEAAAAATEVEPAAPEATSNPKSIPAWKKKSLEFRAAMLASKAITGDKEAAEQEKALRAELGAAGQDDPANDPSKTICPHCGRSFNNDSAQRHINICEKTFGGKKGNGGRLVRGGGKAGGLTGQSKVAAEVPTAARNDATKAAVARRTNAPGGSRAPAEAPPAQQARAAPRAGSHGPPPLPGGRGDQPPSRERQPVSRERGGAARR